MRYVLSQKMFSLGDDFTIRDEDGNTVYKVDGHVFTIGDKMTIYDAHGAEAAAIRQRLISFSPKYEITRKGKSVAIVEKELFTLFRCKYSVDVEGPDDLEVSGDFLEHEYVFKRRGRVVATASKKWFSWTDTYALDIDDSEDPLIYLASAIVIDLICHSGKDD